jgi:hypothetical protein
MCACRASGVCALARVCGGRPRTHAFVALFYNYLYDVCANSTWFRQPEQPLADDVARARAALSDAGVRPAASFFFVGQVGAPDAVTLVPWRVRPQHAACTGARHAQMLGKIHPSFDDVLVGVLEGTEEGVRIVMIRECACDGQALCAILCGVCLVRDDDGRRAALGDAGTPLEFVRGARAPRGCCRATNRVAGGVRPSEHWHGDDVGSRSLVCFPARGFQRASAPVFIALGMLAVACLDTYPIGGGVTSLELLSAGAPIVTYGGGMSVYELLPGFYEAMGFTSLIASSPLEFVQLALRLHRDASWRATTVRSIMKLSYARQCWRLRARGTR